MRWQTRSDVHKLPNTLDARSLMEVTCGDCFTNDIEVSPGSNDLHLLEFHDIFKLLADFASFAEEFGVQEVLQGPIVTEPRKKALLNMRVIGRGKSGSYP